MANKGAGQDETDVMQEIEGTKEVRRGSTSRGRESFGTEGGRGRDLSQVTMYTRAVFWRPGQPCMHACTCICSAGSRRWIGAASHASESARRSRRQAFVTLSAPALPAEMGKWQDEKDGDSSRATGVVFVRHGATWEDEERLRSIGSIQCPGRGRDSTGWWWWWCCGSESQVGNFHLPSSVREWGQGAVEGTAAREASLVT